MDFMSAVEQSGMFRSNQKISLYSIEDMNNPPPVNEIRYF